MSGCVGSLKAWTVIQCLQISTRSVNTWNSSTCSVCDDRVKFLHNQKLQLWNFGNNKFIAFWQRGQEYWPRMMVSFGPETDTELEQHFKKEVI